MTRRPSVRPSLAPSLRRVAVVAALITVTCPLAACGRGNTESWVGTFCGTGVSLRTLLTDANAKLKSQLAANEPPATIAASVSSDATRLAAAAKSATDRIRANGDPSVDQGKGIQLAAIALYEGIENQAGLFPMEVGGLGNADAASLTRAVGPYSQQVADLSGRLARSFTYIQDYKGYAELEKVSRTPGSDTHLDETCAQLQAPSS